MRTPRTRIAAALAGALLACGCAGCGVLGPANHTTGAAANRLTSEVDSATSAVASAQLAVGLLADHRSYATTTDITLLDALDVLSTAAAGLTTYLPRGSQDGGWRADALAATASGQHAVADARSWVNGSGPSARTVRAELKAASDQLDAVSSTLQKASGS